MSGDINPGALEMRISSAAGSDMPGPPLRPLADSDVRFVGEPIAVVVAENRYLAEDAVDLLEVEYEPQSPLLDDLSAIAEEGVELVHPELGSNVAATMAVPNNDAKELLQSLPYSVSLELSQQRQTHVPMECRGIVVDWLAADNRIEVYASTQNPHEFRLQTAQLLGLPENSVRIISNDVGGGFGQKVYLSRDEMCIILASRLVQSPIKWTEDRRENLLGSNSARRDDILVSMAADDDGRIQAAGLQHFEECGAFPEMLSLIHI